MSQPVRSASTPSDPPLPDVEAEVNLDGSTDALATEGSVVFARRGVSAWLATRASPEPSGASLPGFGDRVDAMLERHARADP